MQTTNLQGLGTKVSLWLFLCSFIFFPFYFFKSGGLQIFHVFLFVSLLFNPPACIPAPKIYLLWVFSSLAILVGSVWSAYLAILDPLLLSGVFIIASLFVSSFHWFYLHLGEKFLGQVLRVIALAALIQVVAYVVLVYVLNSELPVRYKGFFNNPNQMGYFALLSLVLSVCIFASIGTGHKAFWVGILCSTFLSLVSLSKAAMLGVFFVLICLIFYRLSFARLISVSLLSLLVVLVPEGGWDRVEELNNVVDRLSTIGEQSDDSLSGRGYDRIYDFSYLLFGGAGEGGLERFNTFDEIHSTLGTLLFCYGVVPFVIFILIGFQSFICALEIKKVAFVWCAGMLAIMAYGVTHAGFRSPFFWLIVVFPLIFHAKAYPRRLD